MKLRIQFSKHGPMKFIGHLDTMRYFQKAVRRAGIDVTYSGGFSPHQEMTFAAPLGVGIESESEYMDLQVNSVTSSVDMAGALDAQMADGFRIRSVRLLPDNTPNAMASVMAASYRINFRPGKGPDFRLREAVERFNCSESVFVTKQTKKNEIELDLKPSVYSLSADEDSVEMCVCASSAGNIKPELVMGALYSMYDSVPEDNSLLITRTETFGRDSDGSLIPLSEIGRDF